MTMLVEHRADGPVATITLNRPDAGNRLTNAMAGMLGAALEQSREARVIVLRGAGADFCAGRDMQPPAPGSNVKPADVMRDDAEPMLALLAIFRRCTQPIICVTQGKAWGIGSVFAGIADVTLATSDATFRLGELERGIPPCLAMSALLDAMPRKALGYLVYSAEPMPAEAALAAGLISAVVPADALEARLQAFIERLLSFPPTAVTAVKQYLASAPAGDAEAAGVLGASMLCNVLASR